MHRSVLDEDASTTMSGNDSGMTRQRYRQQIHFEAHQPTPDMDLTSCKTRMAPPPLVTISTIKEPPLSLCSIILWIPEIATAAGMRNCADVSSGLATRASTCCDSGSTVET